MVKYIRINININLLPFQSCLITEQSKCLRNLLPVHDIAPISSPPFPHPVRPRRRSRRRKNNKK